MRGVGSGDIRFGHWRCGNWKWHGTHITSTAWNSQPQSNGLSMGLRWLRAGTTGVGALSRRAGRYRACANALSGFQARVCGKLGRFLVHHRLRDLGVRCAKRRPLNSARFHSERLSVLLGKGHGRERSVALSDNVKPGSVAGAEDRDQCGAALQGQLILFTILKVEFSPIPACVFLECRFDFIPWDSCARARRGDELAESETRTMVESNHVESS